MVMSIVSAAMALGFLGSLHCAVMCGPLAVVGCSAMGEQSWRRAAGYFGGRLVGHLFGGAVFAAVGAHLGCRIPLHTIQQVALVMVGAFALGKGSQLLVRRAPRAVALLRIHKKPVLPRVAGLVAAIVPRRALSLGLVTGVLPCGMLTAAWALAAAAGRPAAGAMVMGVFSAASAPALVASVLASRAATRFRLASSPLAQGVLWCALAVWIGARSLVGHAGHAGH